MYSAAAGVTRQSETLPTTPTRGSINNSTCFLRTGVKRRAVLSASLNKSLFSPAGQRFVLRVAAGKRQVGPSLGETPTHLRLSTSLLPLLSSPPSANPSSLHPFLSLIPSSITCSHTPLTSLPLPLSLTHSLSLSLSSARPLLPAERGDAGAAAAAAAPTHSGATSTR